MSHNFGLIYPFCALTYTCTCLVLCTPRGSKLNGEECNMQHHIRYFGRFPVSQFNDSLGGVDLKCTQWVHFRLTPSKLYFLKLINFFHYVEYGVMRHYRHMWETQVCERRAEILKFVG